MNPHQSLRMYDPTGNDLNKYTDLKSRLEKNKAVVAMWHEYGGKIIHAVHLQSGEVREMQIAPEGSVKGRLGRVNIINLLFGDWRIATPEQIALQDKINRDKSKAIAEKEATRLGSASGLIFKEIAQAAKYVTDMNTATAKAEASEKNLEKVTTAADVEPETAKRGPGRPKKE